MSDDAALAPLLGGVRLLERAIDYTLGALTDVSPAALDRPTPCRDWELRALLDHLNDSLLALHEAAAIGRIFPDDGDYAREPGVDPVAMLRDRATRLLGAWPAPVPRKEITVDGLELTTAVLTTAGALEVAVHGWDVATACGRTRPIPAALAEEMLDLSPLLVTDSDRPARFAAPVRPPDGATPSDRLVAFLGRHP